MSGTEPPPNMDVEEPDGMYVMNYPAVPHDFSPAKDFLQRLSGYLDKDVDGFGASLRQSSPGSTSNSSASMDVEPIENPIKDIIILNGEQQKQVNALMTMISTFLSFNTLNKFLTEERKQTLITKLQELQARYNFLKQDNTNYLVDFNYHSIKNTIITQEDLRTFIASLTFEFPYRIDMTKDITVIVIELEQLLETSLKQLLRDARNYMAAYGIEQPAANLSIYDLDADIKNKLLNYPFFKKALGQEAITKLHLQETYILPAMINRLLRVSGEVVDLGITTNHENRFALLHCSKIPYFFKMLIELRLINELTTDSKSQKRADRFDFLMECATDPYRIELYNRMCEYLNSYEKAVSMLIAVSGGNLITIFAKFLKELHKLYTSLSKVKTDDDHLAILIKFETNNKHYYKIFIDLLYKQPVTRKTWANVFFKQPVAPKTLTDILGSRTVPEILEILSDLTKNLETLNSISEMTFSDIDMKWICFNTKISEADFIPTQEEIVSAGSKFEAYFIKFKSKTADFEHSTRFVLVRGKRVLEFIKQDKQVDENLKSKFAYDLREYLQKLKDGCLELMKTNTDKFNVEERKMIETMLTSQMYEERLNKFNTPPISMLDGVTNCTRYLEFLLLKKNSNDKATQDNIALICGTKVDDFIDKLMACTEVGNRMLTTHKLTLKSSKYIPSFASVHDIVYSVGGDGKIPKLASEILIEMLNAINIRELLQEDKPLSGKHFKLVPFTAQSNYSNTSHWSSDHTKILRQCEGILTKKCNYNGVGAYILALDDTIKDTIKVQSQKEKSQKSRKSKSSSTNPFSSILSTIPSNIQNPIFEFEEEDYTSFVDGDELFVLLETPILEGPILEGPIFTDLLGKRRWYNGGGNKTMKSKKHKTKKSKKSRKHKPKKPKKSRKSKPQKSRKHKPKKPQKSRKYKPQKSRKLRY